MRSDIMKLFEALKEKTDKLEEIKQIYSKKMKELALSNDYTPQYKQTTVDSWKEDFNKIATSFMNDINNLFKSRLNEYAGGIKRSLKKEDISYLNEVFSLIDHINIPIGELASITNGYNDNLTFMKLLKEKLVSKNVALHDHGNVFKEQERSEKIINFVDRFGYGYSKDFIDTDNFSMSAISIAGLFFYKHLREAEEQL